MKKNIRHIKMINMLRYNFAVLFFVLNTMHIFAQGNLQTEQVDVVRNYNPVLADAVKINITGSIPDTKAKPDTLDYFLPVSFYQMPYQPLKIKPIALTKTPQEELENVYAKAGFGTQFTPLVEAYINSKRSEKFNYGFYGKYISSNGNKENQDYSDVRIGADTKIFFDKKIVMPAALYYANDAVYYYGYNNADTSFKKSDVKQQFSKYGFNIGLANTADNDLKIEYKVKGGFDGISDINKYSEVNPYISLWGEKHLRNKTDAGGSVLIDYDQYKGPIPYKNTIIALKPHYNIIRDTWKLKAAFEFNFENDGFFHPLPDVEFSKNLVGDRFIFAAGWDGHLQKNNFYAITEQNPFTADTLLFKNTAVNERYLALRASTSGNFSFGIKGYQKSASNMPFYVNDTTDMKRFKVVYDNASMAGVELETGYFSADKIQLLAQINLFTFTNLDKLEKPWHTPTASWTLSTTYQFNKSFMMTADVYGIGKSFALLPGNTVAEVKGTVDVNISATYKYSKYFNIFLNMNNLASYKYQRYYNYPSYGFNFVGGLSFSF